MKQTIKIMALTLSAMVMLTACGEETKPAAEKTAQTTVAATSTTSAPETTETIEYDDGTYEIWTYDADGQVVKTEIYDEADMLVNTVTYDYEKDDKDNVLKEVRFVDGVRQTETCYDYSTLYEGELYVVRETNFYDDGTKEVYTYAEDGMTITTECYDADGVKTEKTVTTMTDDGSTTVYYDGNDALVKTETWEIKGDKYVSTERDANGNVTFYEEIPFEQDSVEL